MQLSASRDIEQQCIDQISSVLHEITETQTVEVGTRISVDKDGNTLPEFIRIFASNSQSETMKTTSWNITVEGWAQTETRASELTRLATSALLDSHGLLFGCQLLGGAGNDPHPDYPKMSRYDSIVEVRSRNIIKNI
ncbi:hypothetical protein OZX67_03815 [Bifidobacterium sp. ESL0728]|uniref:hypothetical protein n=1 Tax=Bifidobacterium sp. ESL0728 TaxID=2983220 RepID=UPI0023FA482F|nr:hypothetical protein [Bifidobacterium sp. ESL0728]WEV59674.1 hypothetical protein OZX67_03815 [Bifidobacterium sp. ESL0728]